MNFVKKRLVELSRNRLTVARDFSPRCSITLVGRCTHIGALPTKAARIDLDPETSTQDAFRPAGLISCVACFGSQSILAFLRSPIQDRASLRFVGCNLLAEIWIASLLKTVVDQRIRFPLLESTIVTTVELLVSRPTVAGDCYPGLLNNP